MVVFNIELKRPHDNGFLKIAWTLIKTPAT